MNLPDNTYFTIMKSFILSVAAVLVSSPVVFAGQVLPNLYAKEFCTLRDMGIAKDEAMRLAIASSYVNTLPDLPKVTVGGELVSGDAVLCARAVANRCPQHLKASMSKDSVLIF
jgi:glutaredoxin-related protein